MSPGHCPGQPGCGADGGVAGGDALNHGRRGSFFRSGPYQSSFRVAHIVPARARKDRVAPASSAKSVLCRIRYRTPYRIGQHQAQKPTPLDPSSAPRPQRSSEVQQLRPPTLGRPNRTQSARHRLPSAGRRSTGPARSRCTEPGVRASLTVIQEGTRSGRSAR